MQCNSQQKSGWRLWYETAAKCSRNMTRCGLAIPLFLRVLLVDPKLVHTINKSPLLHKHSAPGEKTPNFYGSNTHLVPSFSLNQIQLLLSDLLISNINRDTVRSGTMDQFEASRPDGPTTTSQPLLETPEHIPPAPMSLASVLEKPIEDPKKKDEVLKRLFPFLSDWKLETSALVLSLLSFIAMTYLLFASDEQPISKWTKSPITLNALVSILAGTSKSSLAFVISMCFSQGKWTWLSRTARPLVDFDRFDAASRGATGSLRVLKSCVRRP